VGLSPFLVTAKAEGLGFLYDSSIAACISFNPYEDKNETFNAIAKLSPKNYKLLKDFVESLSNQDNEK